MTGYSVETWRSLLGAEGRALLERVRGMRDPGASEIAALRREWDAEVVRAALLLEEARRIGAVKFGRAARGLVGDPEGVRMASSLVSARHKAARFARVIAGAAGAEVLDLCAGIGGDAMALRERGLEVRAVDADGFRAWACAQNAGCASAVAVIDEEWVDRNAAMLGGALVHIDPARREEGAGSRRRRGWGEMRPGAETLEALVRVARGVAMKLAPGIGHDEPPSGELEFISERGRLTQAVLWTGALDEEGGGAGRSAGGGRRTRATLLLGDANDDVDGGGVGVGGVVSSRSLCGVGGSGGPVAGDGIGRFVFAVDPSVERAGLLSELCALAGMGMVHPALGLLTGDGASVGRDEADVWLTGFEVLEVMAWNRRRVRAWLAARGAGIVEVKTRGQAVDPDVEQKALRGDGDAMFTVFVLRFDRSLRCVVARRVGVGGAGLSGGGA
ncbi:MAG: THUMP-like domain-containing protein [Phycisphaerales bacterium]